MSIDLGTVVKIMTCFMMLPKGGVINIKKTSRGFQVDEDVDTIDLTSSSHSDRDPRKDTIKNQPRKVVVKSERGGKMTKKKNGGGG
jgi:hypothetical protein